MYKLLIFSIFLIVGCVPKQDVQRLQFFEIKPEAFQKYVNPIAIPNNPNLSLDKSFVNNDYPIEIALYKDNQFYYNLPNLGDGRGSWEQKSGYIELFARRDLFDMYIEIHPRDERASSLYLKFSDRFGPKVIDVINLNID